MAVDVPPPPPTLDALLADARRAAIVERHADIPALRLKALRDAATAYGARAGLARRSYEIAAIVRGQAGKLDGVFNFSLLMMPHRVVPPVLTQAVDSMKVTDGRAIRVSDVTYTIVQQAHFATAAPDWREYLRPRQVWHVPRPDAALLPKDSAERQAWKQFVTQGWRLGVKQADAVFTQSLARLTRDYQGMVLYRRLLAEHMVSQPYVARANLGVTGDGHAMAINDRILRITATPSLIPHSQHWTPLPIPTRPDPAPSVPVPAKAPAGKGS